MKAEKSYSCLTTDGKKIYGLLSFPEKDTNKTVIVASGLTHNATNYLECLAADFFTSHGYAVCRFNYHTNWPTLNDARRSTELSVDSYVEDLSSVIESFENSSSVYLCAQSFSGLAALIANRRITAQSWWDPSLDVPSFWGKTNCVKAHDEKTCELLYDNHILIPKKLVDQVASYPYEQSLNLAGQVQTPTQVILSQESLFDFSGDGARERLDNAFKHLKGNYSRDFVPDSDHRFSRLGNGPAVLEKTLKWFERYPA